MCGFTGMKLGVYKVVAADTKKITIEKADGTKVSFDRKTGKQLNPKNEKYANFIIEDDGSYVNPRAAAGSKKAKKKASAKKVEEPEEEEIEEELEEDEEDEEEEPAPKSKKKKSSAKKSKKKVEDDDEDEYEEVE